MLFEIIQSYHAHQRQGKPLQHIHEIAHIMPSLLEKKRDLRRKIDKDLPVICLCEEERKWTISLRHEHFYRKGNGHIWRVEGKLDVRIDGASFEKRGNVFG